MKQRLLEKQCHWQHLLLHVRRCHLHLKTPLLCWHECLQGSKSSERRWISKALAAMHSAKQLLMFHPVLAEQTGMPAHQHVTFQLLQSGCFLAPAPRGDKP